MRERIIELYKKYIRENAMRPHTPDELFRDSEDASRTDFDAHFVNIKDLEDAIWLDFFEETQQRLRRESVYEDYSVREKLLAFYFTLIEVLKENRSYLTAIPQKGFKSLLERPFAIIKTPCKQYFEELMQIGSASQEVYERKLISGQYANLLWLETEYILQFWLKDNSANYEQTDAAIEKAANLGMDLLGKNVADSVFDFVKFAFQRPINIFKV
ncbi:MAG: TetR/AcrR family transcriptional regulator [Cytophagales bacterium]|nr:MAG: TetR/AcrR family transcriptional regulator [Cytophagales bacterium]TAF59831.1 MAG: TetR/AcrR family transcriptional regulator [Cytophagales bacterium]